MTQEQIDKVYADLAAYEKEIADHNEQVLKSLGEEAQRDFEELMDYCNITDKINLVDSPKGSDNKEHCGVFKNVHVDQWTTNMEGDSYAGFIYANVKGQWIEVPFSC
jgi:hypothetical protein